MVTASLLAFTACRKGESGAAAGTPAAAADTLHDMGPAGDPVNGNAVHGRGCVACHQADGGGIGGVLAASFI